MGGVRGSSSRRLAALAVVLPLVWLSACRDSSETATFGTATTTTVDPAQGALTRKDTPPEGVKEQLDFYAAYQGPPASCSDLDRSGPAVVVSAPNAQVAMTFVLCLPGFAPKQPVAVTVRSPDGEVRELTASEYTLPDETAYTTWTTVPGDDLGDYRVTATQGRLAAKGSFAVGPATSPRTVAIQPSTGPPGTTFRFGFAGFGADSVVDVLLYKDEGRGHYVYLTALPTAMDGLGQAILSIPTAADDPAGRYCLIRSGPGGYPDYFCGLGFTVA